MPNPQDHRAGGDTVSGFVQDPLAHMVVGPVKTGGDREDYRAVVLNVAYCGFESRQDALAFIAAKYAQLSYELAVAEAEALIDPNDERLPALIETALRECESPYWGAMADAVLDALRSRP